MAVLWVTNGEEAARFPDTNGSIWEATCSMLMAGHYVGRGVFGVSATASNSPASPTAKSGIFLYDSASPPCKPKPCMKSSSASTADPACYVRQLAETPRGEVVSTGVRRNIQTLLTCREALRKAELLVVLGALSSPFVLEPGNRAPSYLLGIQARRRREST